MSMFNRVVERPVLVVIVFSLLLMLGLYTLTDVTTDLYPDTSPPMMSVSVTYTGSGPESVEESVTRVLETALVNVTGLQKMSSTSSEGSSNITLEFDYGADLDALANDIRDKLSSVSDALPDGASSPSIFKFDMSSMPIMRLALTGNRTADELRVLAEDYVQPEMEQISGVAQANVQGGRDKIIRVEISQNRLSAYNLTISSVAKVLSAQNYELGGGSLVEGTRSYSIRTSGQYSSVDEIASTVVGTNNGYGVKLKDIATVAADYEDEDSFVSINGGNGVYVSIQKESGANSVNTATQVKAKLKELATTLPKDVSLAIVSDDTKTISNTISSLVESAWEGALLAMIVVFVFLRNWRSTIIVGLAIPISVMITMLAMHFAGLTLNLMTMTGLILGVGMIVDASIINLENIYRYRERGAKPKIAAVLGSSEMRSAVIASTLTHICVFLPVIFFKNQLGMLGQIFQDMIFTIVISLMSSLFVALFLVPVLCSNYLTIFTRVQKPLRNPTLALVDRKIEGAIQWVVDQYQRSLRVAINHRAMTVVIVLVLFVGTLNLATGLSITFSPETSDDSITLSVAFQSGTPYAEVKETMTQIETIINSEVKGVENLVVTGSSGSSGGGMMGGGSTASGEVSITLPALVKRIDTSETIKAKIRAHENEFPGVTFSFGRSRGGQLSSSSAISVQIKSTDYNAALKTGLELQQLIKDNVPNATDVEVDTSEGLPQIELKIDRERAYKFGIDVTSMATEVRASIQGLTATTYRLDGEDVNVVLMLQKSDRQKTLDLENIFVTSSSGDLIPLSNFATLEKGTGPVSIQREDQARVITLEGNVLAGASVSEVESQIKALVSEKMILDENVTLDFAGQWQDIQTTGGLILLILLMAIILIFGVMAGQYESFKDPFINLFTIPLMLVGVVLIYRITGQTPSMFTAVGLVMLSGIVVNNGIVLVDYTNLLRRRGATVNEACIRGGASRLRPVVMTTLTTILGMVPMVINPGENSELIQPIGVTVIGGLTSSTLMTLYFIPVLYSLLNRGKKDQFKAAVAGNADGAQSAQALPGAEATQEEQK